MTLLHPCSSAERSENLTAIVKGKTCHLLSEKQKKRNKKRYHVSIAWEILGKPTRLWPSAALYAVSYSVGSATAVWYPRHWRQAHLGTGSELNAAEIAYLGSRGNSSSVVAPYMVDKSWGTMRTRKHKQIPLKINEFPSSTAEEAHEVIYGRSQCATHKLRVTTAKFHSQSSTYWPLEQFLSQRLHMPNIQSSVKMMTYVSAPLFCQILARQLNHERKFGMLFREISFNSFNSPFYEIITFVI